MLQFPLFACCRIVPAAQCISNLAAFCQLLVQWSMNLLIFVLFYLYYPEEDKVLVVPGSNGSPGDVQYVPAVVEAPDWVWSQRVLVITMAAMAAIVTLAYTIGSVFGFPSAVATSYATLLGMLSLLLSFFQFVPQIFRTYRMQEIGALSIPAMLMQTPGTGRCRLAVLMLAPRVLSHVLHHCREPGDNTVHLADLLCGRLSAGLPAAAVPASQVEQAAARLPAD